MKNVIKKSIKKSALIGALILSLMLITLPSMIITASAAIDDGLLLRYDFSDGAKDVSGKNNNGVLNSVNIIDDGKVGKSAVFDGTTSYIDCSDVKFADVKDLTLAFWAKPGDFTDGFVSILSANGWLSPGDAHIIYRDGSYYQITAKDSQDMIFREHERALNSWEHVVYTVDTAAGKASLYINGQLVEYQQEDDMSALMLEGFAIGAWNNNDNFERFYKGEMADIRLYDRILSADEITQLSSGTTAPAQSVEPATVAVSEPTPEPVANISVSEAVVAAAIAPVSVAPQTADYNTIFIILAGISAIIAVIISVKNIIIGKRV